LGEPRAECGKVKVVVWGIRRPFTRSRRPWWMRR
jgi:hypothetical protein